MSLYARLQTMKNNRNDVVLILENPPVRATSGIIMPLSMYSNTHNRAAMSHIAAARIPFSSCIPCRTIDTNQNVAIPGTLKLR